MVRPCVCVCLTEHDKLTSRCFDRFQLYNSSVPALSMSMLQRAKDAGYGAIVVTLDTAKYGYRTEELDAAYFPQGMPIHVRVSH